MNLGAPSRTSHQPTQFLPLQEGDPLSHGLQAFHRSQLCLTGVPITMSSQRDRLGLCAHLMHAMQPRPRIFVAWDLPGSSGGSKSLCCLSLLSDCEVEGVAPSKWIEWLRLGDLWQGLGDRVPEWYHYGARSGKLYRGDNHPDAYLGLMPGYLF
ncbi:hypothetical protein K438DRAFT_601702 [Mycena galopus ATCC 62051]|nr:hypothetical protein K438DRAFT_601702 [Mycena galopus ATCC 62051]